MTDVPMRRSSGSLVLIRSLIVGFLVDDQLVASHAVPSLVTSLTLLLLMTMTIATMYMMQVMTTVAVVGGGTAVAAADLAIGHR